MRCALAIAVLLLASCSHHHATRLVDGCSGEQDFCAGRSIQPLSADAILEAQRAANLYADSHAIPGPHVYPRVIFHPCFFTVDRICAAGYTSSPQLIHVSTAQPTRTAPLISHETLHARYCYISPDCDAAHTLQYAW